ncbi:hypothetical protein A3F29_03625 [Candidatus Roizmanbacteria bacterium RIFCSPHIGHO2_12_FULL_33_9]|uniref:Uncharacterized protein n=1 Tax=Candidatus Roizmanbacteria bacterium RIFCSPHIGHO2_12_FULL_33_9 TaxID=1802045 RepID=A0A1F7HG52_9BACT|nr:MAG: hypothetical protein A3F29_03625 [Candidatus Roizmanbacteria bacterium RIFCSPHIGHO2_12_FULL_33_9]
MGRVEAPSSEAPAPVTFLVNKASARRMRIALRQIGFDEKAYELVGEEGDRFEFPDTHRQVLIPEGKVAVSIGLLGEGAIGLFWEEFLTLENRALKKRF